MTGLDPSPNRSYSSRSCSRRQSLSQSTELLAKKEPEPVRRLHSSLTRGRSTGEDGGSPPPRRHYERGHPLPTNHNTQPKDAIPFRNQHLGLPSQRRHMEFTSGCSPQRRMTYSNFRPSDNQSQTCPSSPCPRSTYTSPSRWGESRSLSRRRRSTSQSQAVSHVTSHQQSGKCSPTDRHDPLALATHSRRPSSSSRRTQNGSPCQSSQRHSLDSEKLYNNLTSIATSAGRQQNTWQSYNNTETDGYYNGHYNGSTSNNSGYNSRHSRRDSVHNSGTSSPRRRRDDVQNSGTSSPRRRRDDVQNSGTSSPRRRRDDVQNSGTSSPRRRRDDVQNSGTSSPRRRRDSGAHVSDRGAVYAGQGSDSRKTYPRNTLDARSKPVQSPDHSDSSHGSTHSLLSSASPHHSQSPSPSRSNSKQQAFSNVPTTPREAPNMGTNTADRSRSTIRRGLEALILSSSDETRRPDRSTSPPMTFEDYVIIADIPRTNYYTEEGESGGMVRRRPQSQSPQRGYQHQTSRCSGMADDYNYSESRDTDERGRGRERGRDRRERERKHRDAGKQTETQPKSSHAKTRINGLTGEECDSRRQEKFVADQHPTQLNVFNFKKGWLFRLDDDEEWRKYWFVLTNSGLKYYSVSQAEETEEPEGEINLSSCTDVVERDVEKNYGFEVQTKDSVITLSAMTSKIRRSWIEILRRNIFSDNSHDRCHGSRAEILRSRDGSLDDDQEVSTLVTAPLTNQREAGEGRDREQERRLEDRTRWFQEGVMCSEGVSSRWDTIELKKGTFETTDQLAETVAGKTKDIDSKWEDFERLSFGEMKSHRLEASSTQDGEVLSVSSRERVESQAREVSCYGKTEGSSVSVAGAGGPCGPGAPCGPRLRELELLFTERLQEAQKEHQRQVEELRKDKERLLMEEAQTAAKTIESLRKAHREDLEKAKRLMGREGAPENRMQLSEADELREELDGLSERYSDKCVELSRRQQSSRERSTQMGHEKDVEQLRKENQELQSRLTEEITLMRAFITGQRSQSQFMFLGNSDHSTSDLEVLLRAKENEITYLQREISCLRNEVASLMKENQSMCERFKEVYVELSRVKGTTEMELGCLREHLNLTNAALQEQRLMSSST